MFRLVLVFYGASMLSTRSGFTFFKDQKQPVSAFLLCVFCVAVQDERGFNEFSFDEFEKKLAEEESAAAKAAAGELASEDAEEADMFG